MDYLGQTSGMKLCFPSNITSGMEMLISVCQHIIQAGSMTRIASV
jgi:hypothetical protein